MRNTSAAPALLETPFPTDNTSGPEGLSADTCAYCHHKATIVATLGSHTGRLCEPHAEFLAANHTSLTGLTFTALVHAA